MLYFLVIVISILSFGSIQAKAATMVTIPDENLRTAIKSALSLTNDDEITDESLLNLYELDASNKGITSLAGLEYARNLRFMNFESNEISDLSPIVPILNSWDPSYSGTYNYFILRFSNNQLTTLEPFRNVPSLPRYSVFVLDNNQVKDFSPIAHYPENTFYGSYPNQQTVRLPQIELEGEEYTMHVPYVHSGFPDISTGVSLGGAYDGDDKVTWSAITENNGELVFTYRGFVSGIFEYSVTLIQPFKKKVDLSTIEAKDSTIYVGDDWQPVDNFISATDMNGASKAFSESMTADTVDTTQPGVYAITYSNGSASKKIFVTVKERKNTIEAKNSIIYVGDIWSAGDNFVSATDAEGNAISFDASMTNDKVDTTRSGQYQITYRNGNASKKITVTVKPKLFSIKVKDSILYVGDSWNPRDNFVSAANVAGQSIEFDPKMTNETVDTSAPGVYEVTYTNGDQSVVAKITVIERNLATTNLPTTGSSKTVRAQNSLPQTGESSGSQILSSLALIMCLLVSQLAYFKIKRENRTN